MINRIANGRNSQVIIVTVEDFPKIPKRSPEKKETPERGFVNDILDCTRLNPRNIAGALRRRLRASYLEGSTKLIHGRVSQKHRIIYIARYSPIHKKTVIVLVKNDVGHETPVAELERTYRQAGFGHCGSERHWAAIFQMITAVETETLKTAQKKAPVSLLFTPIQENKSSPVDPAPDVGLTMHVTPSEDESKNTEEVILSEQDDSIGQEKTPGEESLEELMKIKRAHIVELAYLLLDKAELEMHRFSTIMDKFCNLEIISTCLDMGMSPNFQDDRGYTLFYAAIDRGKEDVVKLLLERGADLNVPTMNSVHPTSMIARMIVITRSLNINIFNLLLNKAKNEGTLDDSIFYPHEPLSIDEDFKGTFLHLAITTLNYQALVELLKIGADPTVKNDKGQSSLDLINDLLSGKIGHLTAKQKTLIKALFLPKINEALLSRQGEVPTPSVTGKMFTR